MSVVSPFHTVLARAVSLIKNARKRTLHSDAIIFSLNGVILCVARDIAVPICQSPSRV